MNIRPYIDLARPDHWFKNIFMVPGILLVIFFSPEVATNLDYFKIALGFISACLVASSNYVINEILDAPGDLHHPEKKNRPIPAGQVKESLAYAQWLSLAIAGFMVAYLVGVHFICSAVLLWIMGLLYNVRPFRMKDMPYGDVLCESINNPIRMAMGWYATGLDSFPALSVLFTYWMFGAFLMATKRFAEYRSFDEAGRAANYRASFSYYTERRLLDCMIFYISLFIMLSGFFIAKYRLELILATPVIFVCIAYYFHLSFQEDSPVQKPEHLWKARKLMLLTSSSGMLCVVLLFKDIDVLQKLSNL